MTLAPDDPRHGTLCGYNRHRCRCDRCRTANASWKAGYRRARGVKPRPVASHGKRSMYSKGCRCVPCRAAAAAAAAALARRRGVRPMNEISAAMRHGTQTMYQWRKCRCTECKVWARNYGRARRARLIGVAPAALYTLSSVDALIARVERGEPLPDAVLAGAAITGPDHQILVECFDLARDGTVTPAKGGKRR